MSTQIFVNIAVKDLNRSVGFFTRMGFGFNPQFTTEKATCMIIGDNINVMLLIEDFFKTFTKKPLIDPTKGTEAILAISLESKQAVDELYDKAIKAGATESQEAEDHEWMYGKNFQDPDGHLWEVFWMDPTRSTGNQS